VSLSPEGCRLASYFWRVTIVGLFLSVKYFVQFFAPTQIHLYFSLTR
jgi:hypothetical protein